MSDRFTFGFKYRFWEFVRIPASITKFALPSFRGINLDMSIKKRKATGKFLMFLTKKLPRALSHLPLLPSISGFFPFLFFGFDIAGGSPLNER